MTEDITWVACDMDDLERGDHYRQEGIWGGPISGFERQARGTIPTISPPWGVPMPWRLRVAYAWRCIQGKVRIGSDIDVTHLLDEGYMEGRIRVQMRPPKSTAG